MRYIKKHFWLFITISILLVIPVIAQNALPCNECSKMEFGVVVDNYLYYGVEGEGVVRVDLSGKSNIQILDSFQTLNAEEPARCRIQGKFIYGISSLGFGRSQRSFALNKVQLDHFQLNNSNELKLPTLKSINDVPEHLQTGNEIALTPLTAATTDSEVLQIPVFYDLSIGVNYQITLYISFGNSLQIWRLANAEDARWVKGETVDIQVKEPFIIIDKGGTESMLLTEGGEIYALNSKAYSNLTNGLGKIKVKENPENEIPVFIENKDSNEHWIISKLKGKDGKSYVSRSRSLKNLTVADGKLPPPISSALEKIEEFKNSRLKAK